MASDNAFQTIGLFAGGVAAANVAAAVAPGAFDKGLLNALSWGYIASRVVYNLIYITSDSRSTGLGAARTAVWQVGTAIIFTLWIKAGLALL